MRESVNMIYILMALLTASARADVDATPAGYQAVKTCEDSHQLMVEFGRVRTAADSLVVKMANGHVPTRTELLIAQSSIARALLCAEQAMRHDDCGRALIPTSLHHAIPEYQHWMGETIRVLMSYRDELEAFCNEGGSVQALVDLKAAYFKVTTASHNALFPMKRY